MKTGNFFKTIGSFLLVGGLLIFSGCQKEIAEPGSGSGYQQTPDRLTSDQEALVQQMVDNLSVLRIFDEENDMYYDFNMKTREFSFATPNDGFNFSNSDGVAWFADSNGGGILVVSFGALGNNTGGTVIAGNTALDINYTFCFSASDEALGLDLFDFGLNIDGISVVLGIAGDFEALMNEEIDSDSEFTDFFQGYALYLVYDNEASGSYDVLDWFANYSADLEDLDEKGFSYVLDFVELALYFSSEGTLDVSGGSMSFQGEYFSLLDFLFAITEDDYDDLSFAFVSGYGTMGCN